MAKKEYNCGFTSRKHPIFSPVEGTGLYCGESTKKNNCSKLNKQVSKNVSQTNNLLKIHHPFGLNVFCASTTDSKQAETKSERDLLTGILAAELCWGHTDPLCMASCTLRRAFSSGETEAQAKTGILTGLLQCLLTAWGALCSAASSTGMSPWQEQIPRAPIQPCTQMHVILTLYCLQSQRNMHIQCKIPLYAAWKWIITSHLEGSAKSCSD